MIPIKAENLPKSANPERAAVGMERWQEYADSSDAGEAMRAVASDPAGKAVLEAIFGNSPYLGQLLVRNPEIAVEALHRGPEDVFQEIIDQLQADLADANSAEKLMPGLRQAKNRAALLIALADIAGIWPVGRVTRALSDLADVSLNLTVRGLLRQLSTNGVFSLPSGDTPEQESGLVILALGKLGAQELNYSSDIDIMILYEPDKFDCPDPDALPQEMVRLARLLMRVMDERTADGYVFRTDLRLRPDPGATPLAVPIPAAETYYESVGQNWERAAMIRARACAGDIGAGDAFLQHLRPFIWRKHLDFAAIQDIHSIKRQITSYRGGGTIAVNGHNVKLGRGGIREIEFFAQTQQLIWGGRHPALRTSDLCETLQALADHGRIELSTAHEMQEAYCYLRRLEHRLQMVDDHQTHALPKTDEQIEDIAVFAGYPDAAAFRDDLVRQLTLVEKNYAELFEEAPELGGAGTLVFTGSEDHPETIKTLEDMGFSDGASISTMIRRWHHGRYRATRSVRSRELLTELMPRLLEALAKRADPNAAIARLDAFLSGLPAGVQLFSLFYANPSLLDLVAEIMGDAPKLAERLSRNPRLLDHVLSLDFFEQLAELDTLHGELKAALTEAHDFQDVLEITRRWTNDRKFQTGVQILQGVTDGHAAGPTYTAIAETVIADLWPAVEEEFSGPGGDHGTVPGGGMAAIAFGKLGGSELMPESDVDLVFVYDVPENVEESDGDKPLATSVYYMRLSQRVVGAIEALTGEGRLYDVDTRLRPSGGKGPAASRFESFSRYYAESAWTWEHLALTRARAFAGCPNLIHRLEEEIQLILTRPRDPDQLVIDVAKMRGRMAKEHRGQSPWDIKHRRGGLVDAEFMVQYLQLRHASDHPEILSSNAVTAIDNLAEAKLIDRDFATGVGDALRFWHRVQTVLRLTTTDNLDDEARADGPRRALVRAVGVEDFDALVAAMEETAASVHRRFEEMIDKPAAEAAQRQTDQA